VSFRFSEDMVNSIEHGFLELTGKERIYYYKDKMMRFYVKTGERSGKLSRSVIP